MSHNTFGHLFRVTTWGESHGPALGCVVDGCPPGIPLTEADVQVWLDKRRPGAGKFVTQRREPDAVKIFSGVFEDERTKRQVTTGTPISMLIENVDQRSHDYADIAQTFRPGHADYAYFAKYGVRDYRGGGRQSARETAARVAAGAIARKVLGAGVKVRAALIQIGPLAIDRARWDWEEVERNPFWCPDAKMVARWEAHLEAVRKAGSSTGAIVEVEATGVPAGWGAPIYGKLDAEIAAAMLSINASKGVEIGAGFAAAALSGEENADEMRMGNDGRPIFLSNNAGGVLGRHLDRRGGRRPRGVQADVVDPHPAPVHRRERRRGRGPHDGPPRPLCRHPRRPGRRGDDGVRACRRHAAPAGPDRPGRSDSTGPTLG